MGMCMYPGMMGMGGMGYPYGMMASNPYMYSGMVSDWLPADSAEISTGWVTRRRSLRPASARTATSAQRLCEMAQRGKRPEAKLARRVGIDLSVVLSCT